VVSVDRRFQRPQHIVRDEWAKFDTPLIRRTDIDWSSLPETDEYGLSLVQVADEVKSPLLREMLESGKRERKA